MIRDKCEYCGETDLSWGDKRFGHCVRRGPAVKIRNHSGYHPGLARYPGDIKACVDDSWSLQKRVDELRRQGWDYGPSYQEVMDEAKSASKMPSDAEADAKFRELYQKVKAGGLHDTEFDDVNYDHNDVHEDGI